MRSRHAPNAAKFSTAVATSLRRLSLAFTGVMAMTGGMAHAAPEIKTAQTVRTYNLTLPLIFQGAYLGDVPVAASVDGDISVNVERFIGLLGQRLSANAIDQLKLAAAGQQIVGINVFAPAGVTVTYDTAKLELRVTIPVEHQGGQSISALERSDLGQPNAVTVNPTEFSGSLMLTARQGYVWSPSVAQGWDPFRVSGDLSLNFFGKQGAYLFAQGEYDEASGDPWHRGNVVLMHDDTENALRTSIGDVTPVPAGFQSSPILGGLSIQRQFGELQPFRNIRPSGLFRFSLDRASTIDVVVNGATIRTLRLDAGQYDLKDFPLFNGLNDVELYAIDEFGRNLIAAFSQFFSTRLLGAGVAEFGATLGVPQLRDIGDELTYDSDKPAFSGYARIGLTDDITLGFNAQADKAQWLAGTELGWASPVGNFGVVAGWSNIDNVATGTSYLVSYDLSSEALWFLKNPQVNVSYLYTSEYFASLGTLTPNEPRESELRGRLHVQLPLDLGLGLSGSHSEGRNSEPDETRYGVSVNCNLGFLDLTASNEYTERNGVLDENRFLLSLSLPLSERENARATYDSKNQQVQAEYARFQRDELGDYGIRVAALKDGDRVTGSGEFAYNANRFDVLVQHDAIADVGMNEIQSQRTSYTVATQLSFAGKSVALGRPVGQRFAIIAAHDTLDDSAVGVSQSRSSTRRYAQTDFFGPALVAAGSAYQPQSIYVDVENLPAGYDAGTGQYDLLPGTASGYTITIGSEASHVVMGNLMDGGGKPLALLGGEVRAKGRSDWKPVLVFTNSAGRFFAEGLAPGKYEMVLGAALDIVVPLNVPEETAGVIDVGTIVIGNKGN
jgi:outer membrane usher protein